jgi:hypothetical protein
VFRSALLPATGTKPERLAINTLLLGDDEFARFRALWSTDLSQLAKQPDLERAGVELAKLLGADASVDEWFASMLAVLARSALFRTSTRDACAAASVAVESDDDLALVCLNLLAGRAPFDVSAVPVAVFKKTVEAAASLGYTAKLLAINWHFKAWFSCLICEQLFERARDLVPHVRSHFESECAACGETFDDASATLQHCLDVRTRKGRVDTDDHHVGAMLHPQTDAGIDALVIRCWRQLRVVWLEPESCGDKLQ